MKNTITKIKNILEGINSIRWYRGIDQWAGIQSSGNHWSCTEKRKRNKKKWGKFYASGRTSSVLTLRL